MHKDGALVCVWEIKADIGAAAIRAHRPSNLWSTSSAHRISSAVIGYFLVGAAEIVRIRFFVFFSTFNMTTTRQKKCPTRAKPQQSRENDNSGDCVRRGSKVLSFFLSTNILFGSHDNNNNSGHPSSWPTEWFNRAHPPQSHGLSLFFLLLSVQSRRCCSIAAHFSARIIFNSNNF